MRDWFDVYSPWLFIFGFPVICFLLAMLTGCAAGNQFRQVVVTQHIADREVAITHKQDRNERARVKLEYLKTVKELR